MNEPNLHAKKTSFFVETSKALELSGAGSDEVPEPEDVRIAREELKVLHDEKHRTEKLRTTVQKELEQAKGKTRRLEEVGIQFDVQFEIQMQSSIRLKKACIENQFTTVTSYFCPCNIWGI